MTDWNKVNRLEEEISNKRVELIQAPTEEEKTAIKAEIKYLEKQKNRLLGRKEYSRLKEAKGKETKEEEQKIKNYYDFKETESKINPFSIAVKRFLRKLMKKAEKKQPKFTVISNDEKTKELKKVA